MKFFNNLRTAQKLALSFGVCVVICVWMGINAVAKMNTMNVAANNISDHAMKSEVVLTSLSELIPDYRLYEYNHLVEHDPQKTAAMEQKIEKDASDIEQSFASYAQSADSAENKANLDRLKETWAEYLSEGSKQRQLERTTDKSQATELMQSRRAEFDKVREQLGKMSDWNAKNGANFAKAANEAYSAARTNVFALAAIGVFLAAVLGFFVTRSIVDPLKEVGKRIDSLDQICIHNLANAVDSLAKGDLTAKIQTGTKLLEFDRKDEFGVLGTGINAMVKRIQGTVTAFDSAQAGLSKLLAQARMSSESIAQAAGQVSAGNTDLSQRTEEQASSLEETASSMEEMTSTVKQNADNGQLANQLAAQARQVAEGGGEVVRDAVSAMNEINNVSKRIAEIISVIDEIAFQTNLLALNAAVEAARVGEQGRGFAVVAAEVRNLAGRSATAAKEIKALVNDSVEKVEEGSRLVNESGTRLEEIVGAVKKVADVIAEISAASLEQSAGIEQVNKAVMQMDQATQQNASLVEEVSAASQAMNNQAGELQRLVALFQIDSKFLLELRQSAPRISELATGTDGPRAGGRSRPNLKVMDRDDSFEEF